MSTTPTARSETRQGRDVKYAIGSPQWSADVTDRVVQRVAELPDRSSPDGWPEAMLVTADELRAIIKEEVEKPATFSTNTRGVAPGGEGGK